MFRRQRNSETQQLLRDDCGGKRTQAIDVRVTLPTAAVLAAAAAAGGDLTCFK